MAECPISMSDNATIRILEKENCLSKDDLTTFLPFSPAERGTSTFDVTYEEDFYQAANITREELENLPPPPDISVDDNNLDFDIELPPPPSPIPADDDGILWQKVSAGKSKDNLTNNGTNTDEFSDETHRMPAYHLRRNALCKVSFGSRTWDLMMQNFRIALQMDNVFICDHFLGQDKAEIVANELRLMRDSGYFSDGLKPHPHNPATNCASYFLEGPNLTHNQLDGLALMVYKLATYHTPDWRKTSIEITYYPDGQRGESIEKHQRPTRKVLKCLYFANEDWRSSSSEGLLLVKTTNKEIAVQPTFDRLVVFWADSLDHTWTACFKELFLVTIWINQ